MGTPLLLGRAISRSYGCGAATVRALHLVDFSIDEGEMVVIWGPSGAGKSTLLEILSLLDDGYRGVLFLRGVDVRTLSGRERVKRRLADIGMVYQRFHLLDSLDARDNVALPHWRLHGDKRRAQRRAEELLAKVGLQERLRSRPHQLSSGEQQRVALARALVNDPQLVLADEPTGNLDAASAEAVVGALIDAHRAGCTFVFVTHDIDLALRAPRRLPLRFGELQEDDPRATAEKLMALSTSLVGLP